MAQGVNSTKTPARPSHEAIEQKVNVTGGVKSEQKKVDQSAMKGAKRAQNRILSNEETTPSNSIFSK